jgi:hypothetical protein
MSAERVGELRFIADVLDGVNITFNCGPIMPRQHVVLECYERIPASDDEGDEATDVTDDEYANENVSTRTWKRMNDTCDVCRVTDDGMFIELRVRAQFIWRGISIIDHFVDLDGTLAHMMLSPDNAIDRIYRIQLATSAERGKEMRRLIEYFVRDDYDGFDQDKTTQYLPTGCYCVQ